MHEIEAKIRLSKKEFDTLKKELNQKKGIVYKGCFKKEDVYFSNPIPQLTLRIRTLDRKSEFQVKYRSIQQGVEINKEWGWPLKQVLLFKKALKTADLKPYAHKIKRTDLFVWKKTNIELNWVKGLGYFLEIEILIPNEKAPSKAVKKIKETFFQLGFAHKPLEKKTYLELLHSQSS